MSMFQKKFVNTAESCNGMLKLGVNVTKMVIVLMNINPSVAIVFFKTYVAIGGGGK